MPIFGQPDFEKKLVLLTSTTCTCVDHQYQAASQLWLNSFAEQTPNLLAGITHVSRQFQVAARVALLPNLVWHFWQEMS